MSHLWARGGRLRPPEGDKRTIASARCRGSPRPAPPRRAPLRPAARLGPALRLSPRAFSEKICPLRAPAPTCIMIPAVPAALRAPCPPTAPCITCILEHPIPPRVPRPPEPAPLEAFFPSRRCKPSVGAIYFIVDRRGSPPPGPSESSTSHSRYLLPYLNSEGMSLREPPPSERQGSSEPGPGPRGPGFPPRPAPRPWEETRSTKKMIPREEAQGP